MQRMLFLVLVFSLGGLGLGLQQLFSLLVLVVVVDGTANSITEVSRVAKDTENSQTVQQICALNVPRTAGHG